MAGKIKAIVKAVASTIGGVFTGTGRVLGNTVGSAVGATSSVVARNSRRLAVLALIGGSVFYFYKHPPILTLQPGEVGIRINQLTGGMSELRNSALVLPGIHQLRRYTTLDQIYHPTQGSKATCEAPFQSVEGLSIGVDLTVRYALDPAHISNMARNLPEDLNHEIVEPEVQGVIYKTFTHYTVREIFSGKRAEIQQSIEAELKPKLAADGILLRSVQIGQIDLPADYKAGLEKMLAEELASEKMRFTLELKDKQVKETALEAEADKVRREKAAEAAGNEQIIAAKAQEEAMKHVLPFKQKQIEQRALEAEAEKGARIKTAEGTAEARRIEAAGEADSRHKLADAEVYRLDQVGKVTSAQLEREGRLLTKNPLLIQKTMADKLSDKVQVIIAPTPSDGGFIGAALLGSGRNARVKTTAEQTAAMQQDGSKQVNASAEGSDGTQPDTNTEN